MNEGKMNGANLRLKRTACDEDRNESVFKSQRLYFPFNDDQFSQEPFTDAQLENCEINELNYDKIAATTINKKLQILEIRDKIMRSSLQETKEVNVDEIKPMEGTCLDMCPEKERLLRIHGNMVSQFECKFLNSKLEPVYELMVKQYARSSADQANPLSHELRPTSVLVYTMNYMLKNIIYPIESNIEQDLASWYDFCWDRLRAIRKDIVQQNLQNSEVITILEQIGRFHIACYDLMLGYPGFDIKLNTENLNNCIQMLIPMYRDSDNPCLNEPEFVSYELLMHLGNPQFHTAYDLLPTHLKKTPQVRFCIKAHTIYLQSSDCIEFFNLLESTTFMNCCILQRVIPSIRFNSTLMMKTSFTTVKRSYKLEMNHFMEKLCIDDIQFAQEFCSDIQLKYDDLFIELSRKISIQPPEHQIQRQESVIVKKRQKLTYLISGKRNLPDVTINPVQSSFDDNDYFNNPDNLNGDLSNKRPDSPMETDIYYFSNSTNNVSSKEHDNLFSELPKQIPRFEVPSITFNLPIFTVLPPTQTSPHNIETPQKLPNTLSTYFNDYSSNKLNQSTSHSQITTNNLLSFPVTFNYDLFKKPYTIPKSVNPIKSPYKIKIKEKLHFTQLSENHMNLAKKYFCKWQNFVNCRKSEYIEEMFTHPDCISSLSSSPLSVKSVNYFNVFDVREVSKDWLDKQFYLAEKYFYIWLRKVLRKRRKFEIDPINSMPWSVFMQVHGTPKETLLDKSSCLRTKDGKRILKIPKGHPLNRNRTKDDDISVKIADIFVKNVLDTKNDTFIGNKIFWKLAVNYGDSSEPQYIENKVLAIIYGKMGFSSNQVQSIYTEYNKYFIKSVHSYIGLQDWKSSGLNSALIFTNINKEDMETLFKRVDSILQSTPIAIPLVMVFSSSSNKNEIKNYKSVLDTYRENDYINNYNVYTWEGPKTILEAIEFFSENYVDITPGIRSEKLIYNLLNFAQSFYLKMRNLLPEDNPNIIIRKYNEYLNAYIERLGSSNHVIRDLAPELVPYYTQTPDLFSMIYSNLNLKYFEDLLNNAHLSPCELWPPQTVDDLIEYVKYMCQVTNRRCWCIDILQMLQLHRKADLNYCLSNANWYEIIEMWIQGILEKCSDEQNNFIVLYSGNPITDVLNIVFPDS